MHAVRISRMLKRIPATRPISAHPARAIFTAYLLSKWFWIDLFSILTLLFDVVGGEDTKDLTVLRAIRCLRLAKLIRLLRGSRIFKQWEMRISINYQIMELISLTVFILVFSHWVACFWGLQASFNPLNSWLFAKEYCVQWGVADEVAANAMLLNGSCPTDLGGNQMICYIGTCIEGKSSRLRSTGASNSASP